MPKDLEAKHHLRITCGCGFTCKKIREAKEHVEKTGHMMEIKGTVKIAEVHPYA